MSVHCQLIIDAFNACFQHTENTVLVGNAKEPLYQPSSHPNTPHTIYFTRDYTSSALHEIAHWTLAGKARRECVDYGYWYEPDGRTQEQQALFEQVEIKPQAIEQLFSMACGQPFNISADNLTGDVADNQRFKYAVNAQATEYNKNHDTLPPRAKIFLHYLKNAFKPA